MILFHSCHFASLFELQRVLFEVNAEEKLKDETRRKTGWMG